MTGLVLLAAGASVRMGKPKQELLYKGKTLLGHAIDVALDSVCEPVVVVLQPDATLALPDTQKPVLTVHNPNWRQGMSASIHCGLAALMAAAPEVTGAIFMVCDQPFVETALLNSLVQTNAGSGKGIVACYYQGTLGTPVLFNRVYFEELLYLRGKEGAKKLLFRHSEDVATLPFSLGAVDIDTPEDYKRLHTSESRN
ncbi:nucleotidyltransferase family protein [Pontibacter sp. E15-1]|uniref:nucleotidyltransferase family protein n=1 Tax=Pontibacter sp. E15-1 TaxID=2919918 RepID=UPI001F4FB146|nr:nucleotidyltransferase family protein [Pontibacter sp. E15-1]MCJ8165062.1 nucleotidyltransferase family protein [Pontibacter sp. E15-1]